MGSAVGLTTRLCTGVETTYGTVVTPDRFMEFESESLDRQNETLRSSSLGSGSLHLRKGSRSVDVARQVTGDITMEVVTNGMGRHFRNLMGGTPTIAQQAGTAAYLQTHTLGSLTGKSLTIQKQLRDESDTVVATFTNHGCKYTSGEFSIDKKGKLMLTLTVDGEDVDTTTAAASPSLTATKTFHYRQGTLQIAGAAAAQVQSASVKIDRIMDTDRFHLGNLGVKSEPIVNDFPDVTGTLSAEFSALTYYNLFVNDTPASLLLDFSGDVISGIYTETIQIFIPEIRLTGETPKVGGPGLVIVNHPWEAQWDGTSADLSILYRSTDTAI